MASEVVIVFARAKQGQREELGRWYDEEHIPEIVENFSDIVAVRRVDLVSGQADAGVDYDSVAIYQVNGSASQFWERVSTAPLGRSAALDYRSVRAVTGLSGMWLDTAVPSPVEPA